MRVFSQAYAGLTWPARRVSSPRLVAERFMTTQMPLRLIQSINPDAESRGCDRDDASDMKANAEGRSAADRSGSCVDKCLSKYPRISR
jgi:hypothetical protein